MTKDKQAKRDDLLSRKIRSQENGKQTISLAENEIERLCTELQLGKPIQTVAKAIYRQSLQHKFIENRPIGMVAAASVYAAGRVEKEIRSIDEISEIAIGNKTILNRIYSEMSTALELNTGPIDPKNLIPRYSDELNLDDDTQRRAIQIIDNLDGEIISGKSPSSLAAGAIYAACLLTNKRRTQFDVSKVTKVDISTIRYRYQEMIEEMGIVTE